MVMAPLDSLFVQPDARCMIDGATETASPLRWARLVRPGPAPHILLSFVTMTTRSI